jgi:hypothetical protein
MSGLKYFLSWQSKQKNMKKILLTSLILLSVMSRSHAQNVLNPGFESWTAGNPDSWNTNSFSGLICVTQSADAHSGSSSARAEVIDAGGPYPPYVAEFSFPITQNFLTMEFWYKFNGLVNDGIFATVAIYDASSTVIGAGVAYISASTSSYVHAFVPVLYSGTGAASCQVYFTISDTTGGGNPQIGSYFLLDDVQLTNNSSGVQENQLSVHNLKAFPNPSVNKTMLSYSLKTSSAVNISLFDVAGRKMYVRTHERMEAGNHEETIDVSELAAGKYICLLQTDSGTASRMIEVIK